MSRPSRRSTPAMPRERPAPQATASVFMARCRRLPTSTVSRSNTAVSSRIRTWITRAAYASSRSSAAEQIVGYADCVGEDFSIDGMRYTIVGVLGERTSLRLRRRPVLRVYIPFTSFATAVPQNGGHFRNFYVTAPEGTKMADAEATVTISL